MDGFHKDRWMEVLGSAVIELPIGSWKVEFTDEGLSGEQAQTPSSII